MSTVVIDWGAVAYTLVATVVGAFAALWAQGAPVNRGMRSALYATLLFVGCLLLLVGVLGLVFPGSAPTGLLLPGLLICLPVWRRFREIAARIMPIDPASATHATALIVVLLILLLGATKLWTGPDTTVTPGPTTSAVETVVQYLAVAVVACFAVGLGLRRTWAATLQRLGLVRPSPAHVGLGVLAALGLAAVWWGLRALSAPGAPASDLLTATLAAQAANPAAGLVVGLSLAVGMEVLFRGALQPRLGLPVTTLAFVALNVLPPLGPPVVALIVLGLVLGLVRQRTTTTVAIITHATYNGVLVLLALGGGVTG